MKGKPIEEGCLALVVNAKTEPENNGRVVRVIRRRDRGYRPPEASAEAARLGVYLVDRPKRNPDARSWIVRRVDGGLLRWVSEQGRVDVLCIERSYQEQCLIRLDDDEEPKQEMRDTVSHKPKTEEVF